MKRSARALLCGVVAASAFAAGALPAAAQERGTPGLNADGITVQAPPRYKVELVKFHVGDESGPDWNGNDEVYWVTSSVGPEGSATTRASKTWDSADSGDTFYFRFAPDRGCIYPRDCGSAPAPDGIGLSVQLIEVDGGSKAAVVSKTGEYFNKAGTIGSIVDPDPTRKWVYQAAQHVGTALKYIGHYLKDDPLGTQTLAYGRDELTRRLPSAGSSFTETKHFSGDDGYFWGAADYDLTLRVTRVS